MTETPGPESRGESADFSHQPVMSTEVVEVMTGVPAGVVVDATVGGGGHAAAILDARSDLQLVGLDRDIDAVRAARARLAGFGSRVALRHCRFDDLTEVVAALGHEHVVGVLFDLGVSSHQLDRAERGFGYRQDGPLDMRMDATQDLDAAVIVNTWGAAELADLLRRNADERHAGRIARAIVAARPITTTAELAEVVRDAIPAPARRRGGHPAKRSFQAIRIEVNDELAVLDRALGQAIDILEPGGRCAVLAYHSGEDRIVKRRFRDAAGETPPPRPGLPSPPGTTALVRLLWRGTRVPGVDEVIRNPRAESARLRAVERLREVA